MAQTVRKGRHLHYRGKEYRVIGVALHTESKEEFVVYEQLYGDHKLWVRPIDMFLENVDFNGTVMPRFKYISTE